ncbi:MAG: DUF1638 domain-containing protein [Candidatus Latescibacteria bacterium]|nr:DUF1638 domain-containing protein [Candidatus Latescibacterota bacterium]
MRLYIISCEVFCREFQVFASASRHLIDTVFKPFGLHDTPEVLRERLQEAIDAVPSGRYDYILIGYGLCCRGTAGLVARDTPLVFVRAHDCITFFLGSKERYIHQFTEHPGTYYYTSGWIERKDGHAEQGHTRALKDIERQARFERYVERYGEDNARYLIEMETQWLSQYKRAAFIDLGIGNTETYQTFVQGVAETHGWEYEEIQGDTRLIERFLEGEWDPESFLIVPPGQRMAETHDASIIKVENKAG